MKLGKLYINKYFAFLMFHGLYCTIAWLVDEGFANRFDINSVIAFGSYTSLSWLVYNIIDIGRSAYRTLNEKPLTCAFVSFFMGILMSVILMFTSSYIPLLFHISNVQREILRKILVATAVNCPINGISHIAEYYMLVHAQNKKLVITDIVYWVIAIGIDAFVLIGNHPVEWLVYGTAIANLIYTILICIGNDIWNDKFDRRFIRVVLKRGTHICVQDCISILGVTLYTIIASNLSEDLYAIHCIAFAIVVFGEELSVNYNTYTLQRLGHRTKNKVKYAEKSILPCWWLVVLIQYILMTPFLWLYHGVVPFKECLIWSAVYLIQSIPLAFYYFYDALCNSLKATSKLWISSVIGIAIRLGIAYTIGVILGYGLVGLAIATIVDFAVRVVFLRQYAVKEEIKNGRNRIQDFA